MAQWAQIDAGLVLILRSIYPARACWGNTAKPTNTLVFVEDDPDWQWWTYGALFTGNTPWLDGEVTYAQDLGPEENRRLMAAYPTRKAYYLDGHQVREVE